MASNRDRSNRRLKDVIKSAILCRFLTDQEMLKRGVELIDFALHYHKNVKLVK